MPALTLYHAVPSRSGIVRWMLEELGEPYEVVVIDLKQGDQRKPDFLAMNPMGKVPVLRQGDVIVTEAAAICAYLADEFPGSGLNVSAGDPRRAAYLRWLFFAPGCLEPALTDRAYPRQGEPQRGMLGYGDYETVLDVIDKAVRSGPYLLGEQFTAADVVLGSTLRWGMMFGLIAERPTFREYVDRLTARPAYQRADEQDRALAPA
jgi:glutathione S-transferase